MKVLHCTGKSVNKTGHSLACRRLQDESVVNWAVVRYLLSCGRVKRKKDSNTDGINSRKMDSVLLFLFFLLFV